MAEVTELNTAQLKADVAELARREDEEKLDGYDVVLELENLRKRYGLTQSIAQRLLKAEREKLVARPVPADSDQEQAAPDPAAIKAEYAAAFDLCRDLATDPNLIAQLFDIVERMGVIGDRAGVLVCMLVAVSRLQPDPARVVRKGASSGGKSHPIEKGVLPLLTEGVDYIRMTSASARALFYADVDLRHKLLFIPEAAALAETKESGRDEFALAVRELISSGRLDYLTVEKGDDGKLQSRRLTKEGPVAVTLTTARPNLEEELETRLLVNVADESDAQTKRVLAFHARRAAGGGAPPVHEEEKLKWRALQTCLRLDPREVKIPFAEVVAELTDRRQLRIRRDLPGLLSLTKASALLHRFQRRIDDQDRIIAELVDYKIALASLGEGLEELAHGETATVDAVRTAVAEALRAERQRWRRDLFMGAFRHSLSKHLAGAGRMDVVKRLGAARASGRGETVEECLAIVTKAGAAIDAQSRRQLYSTAAKASSHEARKPDAKRPDHVELSTYELAKLLGIGRKAARVRLDNAIEAGSVIDVSPPDRIRPRTAPRWLAPGTPAKPKSANRTGAFPDPRVVEAHFSRGGISPRKLGA